MDKSNIPHTLLDYLSMQVPVRASGNGKRRLWRAAITVGFLFFNDGMQAEWRHLMIDCSFSSWHWTNLAIDFSHFDGIRTECLSAHKNQLICFVWTVASFWEWGVIASVVRGDGSFDGLVLIINLGYAWLREAIIIWVRGWNGWLLNMGMHIVKRTIVVNLFWLGEHHHLQYIWVDKAQIAILSRNIIIRNRSSMFLNLFQIG